MKCLIYDVNAKIIGRYSEAIQIERPEPHRVEIDPEHLWEQFLRCFRKALVDAKVSASDIASLGISSQRNTFTTWDTDTGIPFHNLIVWNDQRAAGYVKTWNRSLTLKAYHAAAYAIYLVTWQRKFLFASNLEYTLAQVGCRLRWMLDNHPGLASKMREKKVKFGCIDTWLLWKLSAGKLHVTEYSSVSGTGLYDSFFQNYSWIMTMLAGIPMHILPEVRDTTGPFCDTDPNVFGAAIPVKAVVGDQQAAMYGQCAFEDSSMKVTLGTGTFIDVNTKMQALPSISGLYPVIGWKIKDSITYLAEGCSLDSGTTILWAQKAGFFKTPEESEAIAYSVPDSGGVCFIPAFAGLQTGF